MSPITTAGIYAAANVAASAVQCILLASAVNHAAQTTGVSQTSRASPSVLASVAAVVSAAANVGASAVQAPAVKVYQAEQSAE